MLPAEFRLTPSSSIKETIRRGRRARRGGVVVHLLAAPEPTSRSHARAAFAVGRSVGNSVARHRVTRQLRTVTLPILRELPPGTQVVVRAMPEAAGVTTDQLDADLRAAVGKVQAISGRFDPVAQPSEDPESDPGARLGEDLNERRTGLHQVLWILGWPLRGLLLALVWVYRNTISPILPPTCRYYPSCSAYAFGALQTHGAAKGFVLSVWRVLRCNPFTPGGLDPVPPRGQWKPELEPDGTPRVGSTTVA